jgi:hypothetical protein
VNYTLNYDVIISMPMYLLASSYSQLTKASLNGDFMSLFLTYPNFGNSAEEFCPYELSATMKLLSSLFINMVPHQHN